MYSPGISLDATRKFGIEIELNSSDRRDFKKNPLREDRGELPEGIQYVTNMVRKITNQSASVRNWEHTHNNIDWRVKYDSSCGMEVCSPPVNGIHGIRSVCDVVAGFKQDPDIKIDHRCSFHLTLDVLGEFHRETVFQESHDIVRPSQTAYSKFGNEYMYPGLNLMKFIINWIKFEPVFMDSVPVNRKLNKYCQCIGMTDLFSVNTHYTLDDFIRILGRSKYPSLNTFHLSKENRPTIEVRIAEGEFCKEPVHVLNWIRLILHFFESVKNLSCETITTYVPGDRWSGLAWLDVRDLFDVLGFLRDDLSDGLKETRNWFLHRLNSNCIYPDVPGVFSENGRSISRKQIQELIEEIGLEEQPEYDSNNILE